MAVLGMGTVGLDILVSVLAFGHSQGLGHSVAIAERNGVEWNGVVCRVCGVDSKVEKRVRWGGEWTVEWIVESEQGSKELGREWREERSGECLGKRSRETGLEEWTGELALWSGEWSQVESGSGNWRVEWRVEWKVERRLGGGMERGWTMEWKAEWKVEGSWQGFGRGFGTNKVSASCWHLPSSGVLQC